MNAPGSFCGVEGRGGSDQLCLFSRTGVVSLFPLVCGVVPKRCRLGICPVGKRLWRPLLRVASFVRGTQPGVEFAGSEHNKPTEENVISEVGFGSSFALLEAH